MEIVNIYLTEKNGDDSMSHDKLKKAYLCAKINNSDITIRICNTFRDNKITLMCVPIADSEYINLKKSNNTKYYILKSICDLLPNNIINFKEYGVTLR